MLQTVTFSFVVKNGNVDEDMLTEMGKYILDDVLDCRFYESEGYAVVLQEVRDSTELEKRKFNILQNIDDVLFSYGLEKKV